MVKVIPNIAFNVVRPDEVAECWEGVDDILYVALWDCVANYRRPSPEDSEEPCHGMDCVADFWSSFTTAQQEQLNALAVKNDLFNGWED